MTKPRYHLTSDDKIEIIKLHLQGLYQREIADKIGCSQPAVSNTLKQAGIKARPQGRPSKIDKAVSVQVQPKPKAPKVTPNQLLANAMRHQADALINMARVLEQK